MSRFSGQDDRKKTRPSSTYKPKKVLIVAPKKESVAEFSARLKKQLFCSLTASDIEQTMRENRRKIDAITTIKKELPTQTRQKNID